MDPKDTSERPSLDNDRAFAEVLHVVSKALVLLGERSLLYGRTGVELPVVPNPEYPGAVAIMVVADLLEHAGTYVEEHTP